MSLLAGLLGFGAGAAQSLAETKKEDMAMERQANLARLSAQYKNEAALEQAETIGRLASSGDPEDLNTAIALGYTPPKPREPKFETVMNFETRQAYTADINDPEVQAQLRNKEIGLVSQQTPAERFVERADADNTQILEDTFTGKEYIRIGRDWVLREESGSPSAAGQEPKLDVFLLEEDEPSRAEDLITGRTTATGTGAESLVRRGASRIPLLGEILEQRTGGFAQEQAESSQFISRLNNQLRAEAARTLQPDGRLQTMVLELVKDVEIPKGILTTPTSTANQFRAVRKEVLREYELAQKRAVNQNISADERMQARQYIERFKPLIDDMSLVILSHDAGQINIKYGGQMKKLNELTFDELKDAARRYDNGTLDLDESQRFMMADLLKVHQYYNQ